MTRREFLEFNALFGAAALTGWLVSHPDAPAITVPLATPTCAAYSADGCSAGTAEGEMLVTTVTITFETTVTISLVTTVCTGLPRFPESAISESSPVHSPA